MRETIRPRIIPISAPASASKSPTVINILRMCTGVAPIDLRIATSVFFSIASMDKEPTILNEEIISTSNRIP
ncbi:hypothetical protein D3C86_1841930 [compost metagenome]